MNKTSLTEKLDRLTVEGTLYQALEDKKVRCLACGHRCPIADGHRGACQVRFNRDGKLYVPYGYTAGLHADPIEKKPLFHVLPGADALTFGMLGCDFHCAYCQNWMTAQTLRDDAAGIPPRPISAQEVVDTARRSGSKLVVSSYNEPLISTEWALSIFGLARESGLMTGFVSNGHATPEVLEALQPVTDCYKVDLKSMRQANYRELGGHLKHVLWTIEALHRQGFWVEIVTLVVPGFNDSNAELWDTARFIAGISPGIPWHVTAFHGDYKMQDTQRTPVETLVRASEIGVEAGLNFVYAGNIPGRVRNLENTYCPGCQTLLISRVGFGVERYTITPEGKCPSCGTQNSRPVVAGLESQIAITPTVFAAKGDEGDRGQVFLVDLFAFPGHAHQVLKANLADRRHQHAPIGQLGNERGRYLRRPGRDDDAVKRSLLRPTIAPVPYPKMDVVTFQGFENSLCLASQLRDALHGEDLAGQPAEDGRLVAGAGADFQHPVPRVQSQYLAHVGHDVGLGDGLALTDAQRAVAVGQLQHIIRHEAVAGHLAHSVQDPGIGDTPGNQPVGPPFADGLFQNRAWNA